MDLSFLFYSVVCVGVFLFSFRDFEPSNWLGPARGGWSEYGGLAKLFLELTSVLQFIVLMWGLVNVPRWGSAMLTYITAFLAISVVTVAEMLEISQGITFYPLAILEGDVSLLDAAMGGFLGLLFFLAPLLVVEPVSAVPIESPFTTAILVFLVFTMVYLEEEALGSVSLASLAENFGIIPALVLNPVVFGFFHYAIYSGALTSILVAVLFRFCADCLTLKYRSMFPALVAHLVIVAPPLYALLTG